MSTIESELESAGIAQVIVVPNNKNTARIASKVGSGGTFRSSERSIASAIARSGDNGAFVAQSSGYSFREFKHLGVLLGFVDAVGLAALKQDPDVADVRGAPQLSLIRPTHKAPAPVAAASSTSSTASWGAMSLEADKLWAQGLTGKGVLVGHLDTGVDGSHPALAGAIAHFAEFDRLGFEKTPSPAPFDSDDHGTHTAGTIAGRHLTTEVKFGIAPGAMLASAVVIEGGDAVARVLAGLDWIIERGARILSMSLGFRGFLSDFVPIFRILRQSGVLPVIAVGNEGPGTSRSPGNYMEALSVGAIDDQNRVPNFSSSREFQRTQDPVVPDLVAPGVDIFSAAPGGGFQLMNGTSMATPHIAGLAALLLEANPKASVDELEDAILTSCTPISPSERSGKGTPNGPKALKRLS